jgi:hypothetical protein
MLGKLIKYDLLYNWRMYAVLMGALAAFGLSGALIPDYYNINWNENLMSRVFIIVLIIITGVISAAGVQCVVATLRGYRRSLFKRWGYLTMTLPVKSTQLIASKFITAFIWFNAVMITTVLASLLFAFLSGGIEMNFENFRAGEAVRETLRGWVLINLCVFSVTGAAFLSATVVNVSVNGKQLGFIGGLVCFTAWMTVWGMSLRYAVIYLAPPLSRVNILPFHFALFLILSYCLNVALMNRKVNLP